MRKRVIGALLPGQQLLIAQRAWPLVRPDYTSQEIAALAYMRGLSDAAETLKATDTARGGE